MRPRGDIRKAIASAAKLLADEQGKANWREIAERANVGMTLGRWTVRNMVKAGELQTCGTCPVNGARRPMALYAPTVRSGNEMAVEQVLRSWTRS